MSVDPLFPAAMFLPLGSAEMAALMAETSLTYVGGVFQVDDFTAYHHDEETG